MLLEKNVFCKWWVAKSTWPRGAGRTVKSQYSTMKTSRRFNIQLNLKPVYLENKGEQSLVLQTFCHKIKHEWPQSKGLLGWIKTLLKSWRTEVRKYLEWQLAWTLQCRGPKEMKEFRIGHWDLKNNLKVRFHLWDIFCFLLDSTRVSN